MLRSRQEVDVEVELHSHTGSNQVDFYQVAGEMELAQDLKEAKD